MDEHPTHDEEIDDGSVAHAVMIGVPIGVVVFFGLTLVVCLLGGQTFGDAVVVSLWPALVGGPFIGGVFGMASVVLKMEEKAKAERPAPVTDRASVPLATPAQTRVA